MGIDWGYEYTTTVVREGHSIKEFQGRFLNREDQVKMSNEQQLRVADLIRWYHEENTRTRSELKQS